MCHTYVLGDHLFGTQTSDTGDASSFATSMSFDYDNKRLYITGATTGVFFSPGDSTHRNQSDCFVACLQLPSESRGNTEPIWLRRIVMGQANVSETCSSIYLTGSSRLRTQRVLVTGYARVFDRETSMVGIVTELSSFLYMRGGYTLEYMMTQLPQSIQYIPGSDDFMVASMASSSHSDIIWNDPTDKMVQLDSTMTVGYMSQPGNYSLILQRVREVPTGAKSGYILRMNEMDTLMDGKKPQMQFVEVWGVEHESASSVQLSGILPLRNGKTVISGGMRHRANGKETNRGFVSIFDSTTGGDLESASLTGGIARPGQILGLCQQKGDLIGSFFVVGVTDVDAPKDLSRQSEAFIARISSSTYTVEWMSQLRSMLPDKTPSPLSAMGCAVSDDGEVVYMAGTVEDGAGLTLDGKSLLSAGFGGEDIYLSQIQAVDGELVFVRQMGTSRDDRIAPGKGVLCDSEGNAILLGTTQGSFFSVREYERRLSRGTDVVVFSVDRTTGRIKNGSMEQGGDNGSRVAAIPTARQPDLNTVQTKNIEPNDRKVDDVGQSSKKGLFVVGILISLNSGLLGLAMLVLSRRRRLSRHRALIKSMRCRVLHMRDAQSVSLDTRSRTTEGEPIFLQDYMDVPNPVCLGHQLSPIQEIAENSSSATRGNLHTGGFEPGLSQSESMGDDGMSVWSDLSQLIATKHNFT